MNNPYHLSTRELEVVALLMQGKSNKQIALALGISERTVEFHLKNIYAKLHVSSKPEAILKLGESIGLAAGIPGKSTVAQGHKILDNQGGSNAADSSRKAGASFSRNKALIFVGLALIGIVLIGVLTFMWAKPIYERECEYPDEATVGQAIPRSHASGSHVHGQLGTTDNSPWPKKSGYVIYKNILTPQLDHLYLKLRYSKNSPSSAPILIYIDDEAELRLSFIPINQGDWNRFTWTEPLDLGAISKGVHTLKFYTDGQEYGVADLDKLILTNR